MNCVSYSKRETFFWRDDINEMTGGDKFAPVRDSVELAKTILICLARSEVSIHELDKVKKKQSIQELGNIIKGQKQSDEERDEVKKKKSDLDLQKFLKENGGMRIGPLPLNWKKVALATVAMTGTKDNRLTRFAMLAGLITEKDLTRAKKRNTKPDPARPGHRIRLPECDPERFAKLPSYLVDYWCGNESTFAEGKERLKLSTPPLCRFSNKALSDFCSRALGEELNESTVRKWVSRLHLTRPDKITIKEVKSYADGICFCR